MNEYRPPFFSVILPVYNGETYLSQAIESVLKQKECDWELILIDDCSSDHSRDIIESYELLFENVRGLYNEKNLNIAGSLNRGIDAARGEWIVRLDCDDLYADNYLSSLRAAILKAPGSQSERFFSSWISVIDRQGEKVTDVTLPDAGIIRRMMRYENFLCHPATSFSKEAWRNAGGYPERDRTIAEDTAMWRRFFDRGMDLVVIPEFLVHYRIHGSNITSVNDARLFKLDENERQHKADRQYYEWRISLFLKQAELGRAREEIKSLCRMQKNISPKNLQYYLLTFLPEPAVRRFMWEIRPCLRSWVKDLKGRHQRV